MTVAKLDDKLPFSQISSRPLGMHQSVVKLDKLLIFKSPIYSLMPVILTLVSVFFLHSVPCNMMKGHNEVLASGP